MCRTSFDARRIAPAGAMIAFNRPVAVLIAYDDAERANHDTGPAGYASVRIIDDFPRFPVPGDPPGNTCLGAKGIFAVAALQCYRAYYLWLFFLADALHMNPLFGKGMLLYGIREHPGFGVGHRAGDLTGPAGKALFNNAIDTFHK